MIIKPYSELREEAFVASDYPSVKLFLKCNDTGAGLYDEVSGTTLASADEASVTKNGTKVVFAKALTSYTLPQTFTLDTANYHLFVSVFEYATGAISPGCSLTDGTDLISIGGINSSVSDGANSANSSHTGTSVATVYGGISQFKAGTTGEGKHTLCSLTAFDGTTNCNSVNASAADLSAALTVSRIDFSRAVGGSVSAYLAAYIKLASAPSDGFVRALISWMTKEASAGNKAIYPGLKWMS